LQHKILSTEEIRECLERSGYLLESLIVRELSDRGFFVEPNQVVLDPHTGKSRELDIVAEHYSHRHDYRGTCVKTHFVAEVVNNKFPVVLLTKRPSTPHSNFESYVKFGCTPEPNDFHKHFDFFDDRRPPQEQLFAQYCALSTKRGDAKELMASHPEDMYASLQKVAEYVEREIEQFAKWSAEASMDIWRVFFWHPILVVGGQLVIVENDEAGTITLAKATSAFLEFNWHQNDEPRTTVIEVVTVAALYERMEAIVASDQALEVQLHTLHAKSDAENA
jgi:hypothetical protein